MGPLNCSEGAQKTLSFLENGWFRFGRSTKFTKRMGPLNCSEGAQKFLSFLENGWFRFGRSTDAYVELIHRTHPDDDGRRIHCLIRPHDYVCDSLFFEEGESRGEGAISGEENALMSRYDNQEGIETASPRATWPSASSATGPSSYQLCSSKRQCVGPPAPPQPEWVSFNDNGIFVQTI